uniref:Chloride channel protein n=1 Tax=Cannabis sativa TaxID=3483 RepID=A0A803NVQ6_CANSA
MATLFTTKNFNHNALKNYLEKHWKGRFPVSVKERSPNSNLYLAAFHCEGDRRRTILNQPWTFDKCPILLEIPDTDSALSPETMRKIPFWVQVHNIPFSRRSISLAKLLGQITGTLLEIHQPSLLETWGSYMRVRIMFDVTKPLPRGIPIVFPGLASPTWLELKYEDIPDHCYYCGRLGHSYPSCTEYMRASDESTQPPPLPYENVLRGTSRPNHGPFGLLPNPFTLNSPAIVSLPSAPSTYQPTNLIPINHPRGQVLNQDFSFHNNPPNYADARSASRALAKTRESPLGDQGAGPSNLGSNHSFAPPGQLHSIATPGPNFAALLSVATGGNLSCSVSPQQSSNPGSRGSSSPSSSQLQAPLMISTSTAQLDPTPVGHMADIPSTLAFAIGSNDVPPRRPPQKKNQSTPSSGFKRQLATVGNEQREMLKRHRPHSGQDVVEAKLGFDFGFEVPRVGLSGGLFLLWTSDLDVTIINYSLNHIHCFISSDSFSSFNFTAFYGAPNPANRPQTWELLSRIGLSCISVPWCVLGDFNDFLTWEDKSSRNLGNGPSPLFRTFINKFDLQVLQPAGQALTWTNNSQGNRRTLERLDWAVGNSPWHCQFPNSILNHLDFFGSDHRAIQLSLNPNSHSSCSRRKDKRFLFENVWLSEPNWDDVILEAWSSNSPSDDPSSGLLRKQSNCSTFLSSWKHKAFFGFQNRIKQAHQALEQARKTDDMSSESYYRQKTLQANLDSLLLKEETYWKQRSRIQWLQLGDKNTRFFHKFASNRKRSNRIDSLTSEDGTVCHDPESILSLIQSFYSNLFTSQSPQDLDIEAAIPDPLPLPEPSHYHLLEEAFSSSEIPMTNHLDKYLGLPQCFGRSKSSSFNSLKDRIWTYLSKWNGKFLSKGGKEVLLKAVIQAIPSYAMSVFKLPDSFCNFVEKEMANFWWGIVDGKYKLHWKKWKLLCNSKSLGGLGFRSLKPFNQAMLAKQAWRIHTNQSPLLTQLFKAKYFPRTPFLDSSLGHYPSAACFVRVSRNEKGLVRNQASRPETIEQAAHDYLAFYQAAQDKRWNNTQSTLDTHLLDWEPPPVGLFKLNTDAAISSHQNRTGGGALVRGHSGEVLAATAFNRIGQLPPQAAEGWVLLEALKWCHDQRINIHHVEVDCKNLITALQSSIEDLTSFGNIIKAIRRIAENELFKQDWRSKKKVHIFQYVLLKWAFALLIGLGTGLVGFLNNIAVENIADFKLLLTTDLMSKHRYYTAFAAFAGCNIGLAVAAGALCAYIAPAAAGSGIPEVKAYLNGIDAHSILAPSTLLVKIFGSILGVSAGFVVGKEGPMVHTGACIASLLGQGGSRKYHLTWSWLRYFKNDRDRRDLITCGAAAGVAAAFRAPVGGVLFALEEAASWSTSLEGIFTTAVVAIVMRAFIQFCSHGKCGLFGLGGLIMYDVSSAEAIFSASDILAVIFLGVIGGLLGSLYNYLVDKVVRTYSIINEKGPVAKILLVMTIAILTSCCSFFLPWSAKCIPCPEGLTVSCPTVYSAVYFLGIVTYGIAIPSGLFIPVILAGACYGRLVGRLFETASHLDTGLFALLGAASFLGGTMRMTVSLCIILLELTNDLLLLPLVMLVLLISKTVGDCFNKGVYDQILKIKGLPYMEAHSEPFMRHLVAGDVVSCPLITFSGIEKVGTILHALRITGHNGFPVIDEPPFSDSPELCGLVLRSHLLVLLKGKNFTKEKVMCGREILGRFSASDFAKAGSGKGIKLEDIDIEEEEMEMYVDLHPITNTSPYTVVDSMSLAKAAILFRQLGLRHMCVVPRSQKTDPIVGILTRHDFMEEHILGLYPHMDPHKQK